MNQIKSFVLLTLVLLIVAPTFASTTTYITADHFSRVAFQLTNNDANHSQSDLQLAYEEREKEEESVGEQKSKHSAVYVVANIFSLSRPASHHTLLSFMQLQQIPLHVPLYLIKRSIRI